VAQDAAEFVQFDPFQQVNLEWTKSDADNLLPITGQGTISIRTKAAAALTFTIDGSNETSLILYITNDSCDLYFGKTGAPPVPPTDYTRIPAAELKGHAPTYLEASTEVLYWLSVDNDNGVIRFVYAHILMFLILTFADMESTLYPPHKPFFKPT
jgi:hypothetical protein